MKKAIIAILLGIAPLSCFAQKQDMASLFKAMPDSLMPYLSKNNRLDMIDFMEAHMKAEITNLLDGRSEMTALTADSLSLRLSDVLRVDMKLQKIEEPVDSSDVIVCVWRTYTLKENQTACIADTYTAAWRLLKSDVVSSSFLKRDETVFLKPHF